MWGGLYRSKGCRCAPEWWAEVGVPGSDPVVWFLVLYPRVWGGGTDGGVFDVAPWWDINSPREAPGGSRRVRYRERECCG